MIAGSAGASKLDPMEIRDLLQRPESEWLDFKLKYHDNTATFLHDVLCLANAYSENDRYLVFGVAELAAKRDLSLEE